MTSLPPVICSIEVATPIEHAFTTFTDGVGTWWPAATHSVGKEQVRNVILETHEGGRFYEEWLDGTLHTWGLVVAWEPPQRFVVTWHPGLDPEESTEVEVTFSPTAAGTIVELTHRGWEKRGSHAAEKRAQYESGWPSSLRLFRDEAERSTAGSAL